MKAADPDAQTRMIQDAANVIGALGVLAFLLIAAYVLIQDGGQRRAYARVASGQATVITYTVPGQGACKAVLVDGERRGEVCEGEQ